MAEKDIEVTIVPFKTYSDIDFRDPSSFYIRNGMGDRAYFHTRDRLKAQVKCNNMYGVGMYTVQSSKISKGSDNIQARGFSNSKSRAGSNYKNICAKQGRF